MDAHSFDPFPVLHTPRLILRQPCDADAAALLPMRSDPEVMRYIPRPLATSEDDVRALLCMIAEALQKSERINWAIEWRESGEAIGLIGYVSILPEHRRAEVGYSLRRDYHRRGIMREALAARFKTLYFMYLGNSLFARYLFGNQSVLSYRPAPDSTRYQRYFLPLVCTVTKPSK